MAMNNEDQLLTLEDVADRLKISVSTVRRWVKSNELRSIKVGNRGQYRISLRDLEEFLAEQEAQQPDMSMVATFKRGREWRQAIDWAREHTKYIVVIGGVISGLGKGNCGRFHRQTAQFAPDDRAHQVRRISQHRPGNDESD